MRLTSANKEIVRLRILEGSAKLFREYGYDGVNIDDLMRTANLTRGAFYVHFKSKSDLFKEVIRHKHPLLRLLKAREGRDANALWDEMLQVFEDYMAPENLSEVSRGCTLVALTEEVARADYKIKQAYDFAWNNILREMSRGQPGPVVSTHMEVALVVATGALGIAAATADKDQQARILVPAWQTFLALTEKARSGQNQSP